MARPGSVRHKVLSSGRLTGSAKLASGGKQNALRKVARPDADFGYSLYSTDSEDQVATIHHGLDRCASLLKDILQNESEGMENLCQKAGKAAFVRTASRPLLSKVNGSKKRGQKKKSISANVRKGMAPIPNKPASVNAAVVEKDTTPVSTGQPAPLQPIHIPCTQHSPVIHEKLCEHVQTQMSLLNTQPLQKSSSIPEVPCSIVPEHTTYQPVTAFNSRLPTSTPALSPQYAANPSFVQPGAVIESCTQCASQMGLLLPEGPSGSTSGAQGQTVPSCSALPHMIQSALNNPTPPTVLAPPSTRETVPDQGNHEQQIKEADLIRCIQAHLALLQAHEKENGKVDGKYQDVDPIQSKPLISREDTAEEYSEGTLSEEENLDGVDTAPVRDTSCQTSFDKDILKRKKTSLQKTAQKVKTVKYLLGELKALLTDQDDSEILRVLGEVEDTVSLLPAVVGNANVQAEIALAVQPLRSENAQLRRRLRILNQQLKNQERAEKECNLDSNYEFSLQSLNITLQSQLNEYMKSNELLRNKNEEIIKMLQSQKEENRRLTRIIHKRDQELHEKQQQYDIFSTRLKIADDMLNSTKSLQYKLEVAEKENQILGITLRQKDAEVNRLHELTRALQGSMSKLLSDLTVDTAKPKQERSLSKALLEIHEKQLQADAYPLSDSVMSYLKNLETSPILAEPVLPKSKMKVPGEGYDMRATEDPPLNSPIAGEIVAPKSFAFLKPEVEAASNSSTLVEGHGPDETIYIPLSSSPSQKPAAAAESTDTQCQVPPKQDCNFGLANTKQPIRFGMPGNNAKAVVKLYGSFSPKKTAENKSESKGKTAKLEGDRCQMQPKEITNEAAKMISDDPDGLQPDKFFYASIPHQKENTQKKGPGISVPDSSFSTFDWMSGKSEWTISSFSTFTSRDEEDFKNGLAALDANIARLQKTLQNSLKKTASP
ncbi:coiled-coil domain-containing protein 14 isoform X2 [Podarcis raffonei]|uniref:coiled-coil domain-containing protein 14 isoform X2 n=1 Tax=Podarcis raffonei TaxID=65483 RepID=UPI00232946D6|nr:coiled-coil domain-containing protein 14 isoform X2 [Podarcis raffonei]